MNQESPITIPYKIDWTFVSLVFSPVVIGVLFLLGALVR